MALRTEASREDVAHGEAARFQRERRRAPSGAPYRVQMGCPEGASAECGSAMPSASPTTCEVAAVPRNWQPPPGVAQARQSILRGGLERHLPVGETRAGGLHFAGILALFRQQSDAAGHQDAGQRRAMPASAIIMAGRPLSQVATPITPRRVGSERMRRRKTVAASLR